jgi:hypothetical protein
VSVWKVKKCLVWKDTKRSYLPEEDATQRGHGRSERSETAPYSQVILFREAITVL